jgi:hypothetical protein
VPAADMFSSKDDGKPKSIASLARFLINAICLTLKGLGV